MKLRRTITSRRTVLICITGFIAIVLVLLWVTTGRAAVSAQAQSCILPGELDILQEVPNVQEEHAAYQYDCDPFHFLYNDKKLLSMNV